MKKVWIFIVVLAHSFSTFSQVEKDYSRYHQAIIDAEYQFFINDKPIEGLKIFRQTFNSYDFIYVDDCIEAFQLALVFKQNDYAMAFIKKALENGFELYLLDELSTNCVCRGVNYKIIVTLHQNFVNSHRAELAAYADACYKKYIQRIDRDLLAHIVKRHVREQLFKDGHKGLAKTFEEQEKEYKRISDDNLRFMDSLAGKHIYLGERNLGIYTNKQAANLGLPFRSIENYQNQLMVEFGVPLKPIFGHCDNVFLPLATEEAYFDTDPVYIMLYHNRRSYDILSKYKDEAIQKGYLHPREYASLKFNIRLEEIADDDKLYLQPSNTKITDPVKLKSINEKRRQLLLASYESDFKKHQFEHAYNVRLCFGMFDGSR